MRPIWLEKDTKTVKVIDQRKLPHEFVIVDLCTLDDVIAAIKEMYVRGAPLIGVTAAYGIYLAVLNAPEGKEINLYLKNEVNRLKKARPTAVNLAWAADRMFNKLSTINSYDRQQLYKAAQKEAYAITEEEAENCKKIGEYGASIIKKLSKNKGGKTVNILTHCNAGWLACIEYGTATAPIYTAFDSGIDIHVWVDETRPLNQGARLTAWELGRHGVSHTVITDNAGGHLMQHSMVDIAIVGTDRTSYTGDVANKIGTYLKALAAKDNDIPFYVALPSSTFDWTIKDGIKDIPIEKRDPNEIKYIIGALSSGKQEKVLISSKNSPALNYAFDVTPARFITGFITERGICKANESAILSLFPERL